MSKVRRHTKLAVTILAGIVVLLLVGLWAWPRRTPARVDQTVTNIRLAATNVMQVSLTFSNASSRTLYLIDDVDGHPLYHLAPHPDLGLKYGVRLGHVANTRKLELKPTATLSETLLITNPMPRFRILVPIQDPPEDVRNRSASSRNSLYTAFQRWRLKHANPEPPTTSSGWIEPPSN